MDEDKSETGLSLSGARAHPPVRSESTDVVEVPDLVSEVPASKNPLFIVEIFSNIAFNHTLI